MLKKNTASSILMQFYTVLLVLLDYRAKLQQIARGILRLIILVIHNIILNYLGK